MHFANDANGLDEHHRLLLEKLGPGRWRWIVSTPDLEFQVLDLNVTRHRILGRRAASPVDAADQIYAFDPLSRADLERLKKQAGTMVLGDEDVEDVPSQNWMRRSGCWRTSGFRTGGGFF